VYETQESYQFPIIDAQLREHLICGQRLAIAVSESLFSGDFPDGPKRPSTDLPCTFSDSVSHAKDLIGLLIQKQW